MGGEFSEEVSFIVSMVLLCNRAGGACGGRVGRAVGRLLATEGPRNIIIIRHGASPGVVVQAHVSP